MHANKKKKKNYWIKVKGYDDCEPLQLYQTAILEYDNDYGLPQKKIDYNNSGPNPYFTVAHFLNSCSKKFYQKTYIII